MRIVDTYVPTIVIKVFFYKATGLRQSQFNLSKEYETVPGPKYLNKSLRTGFKQDLTHAVENSSTRTI